MHPQIHSQDNLHFTITLIVLRDAALPHLKRGTAALESRHKEVSAHADFPRWLETLKGLARPQGRGLRLARPRGRGLRLA